MASLSERAFGQSKKFDGLIDMSDWDNRSLSEKRTAFLVSSSRGDMSR